MIGHLSVFFFKLVSQNKEKTTSVMEYIQIERVAHKVCFEHIHRRSKKNKISASLILLKHYSKQKYRNYLKQSLYTWRQNCIEVHCSIAKTSNKMYNSNLMSDILKNKMEKKQDYFVKEKLEKQQRVNRFKDFLLRTKRCYKRETRDDSIDILDGQDTNTISTTNKNHNSRTKNRSIFLNTTFQTSDQLNFSFPNVYMKKMKLRAKVNVNSILNHKMLFKWFDNLFLINANVKRGGLFQSADFIFEDEARSKNVINMFADEILDHKDTILIDVESMSHYLVKTPLKYNLKLIHHGISSHASNAKDDNHASYHPLWIYTCNFAMKFNNNIPDLFRLALMCLAITTKLPGKHVIEQPGSFEYHRTLIINALFQSLLCKICLIIIDNHHYRNEPETKRRKITSKALPYKIKTTFENKKHLFRAKNKFCKYMKYMLQQAEISPKLQEAEIVQAVKPFANPKHIPVQQEILKGGMVVDDTYLYSENDKTNNMILYKVEYLSKINVCPNLMDELRFNYVSSSYFTNDINNNSVYFVKCFPNAKNMIFRSFSKWRNATDKCIINSLRKKLLSNIDTLSNEINPTADLWNCRLLAVQKSISCFEKATEYKLMTKQEMESQKIKIKELIKEEEMLQKKIRELEFQLKQYVVKRNEVKKKYNDKIFLEKKEDDNGIKCETKYEDVSHITFPPTEKDHATEDHAGAQISEKEGVLIAPRKDDNNVNPEIWTTAIQITSTRSAKDTSIKISRLTKVDDVKNLHKIFHDLVKNNNGLLEKKEFRQAAQLRPDIGSFLSPKRFLNSLAELKTSEENALNVDEFISFCIKIKKNGAKVNIFRKSKKRKFFAASTIQSVCRYYICRKAYTKKLHASIKIQSVIRQHLVRKKYVETIKRKYVEEIKSLAASKIQSICRYYICRKAYTKKQHASVKIQSMIRQHLVRKKYVEVIKSLAASKIQSICRYYICRKAYTKKQHASVKIQSMIRQHLVRKKYVEVIRSNKIKDTKNLFNQICPEYISNYSGKITAKAAAKMLQDFCGIKEFDKKEVDAFLIEVQQTKTGDSKRYFVGNRVEADCNWGMYYNGIIEKVNMDETYVILFDDGEKINNVKEAQIRQILAVGDTVKADCDWGTYYHGIIKNVNSDGTYYIVFDDGEEIDSVSKAQIVPVLSCTQTDLVMYVTNGIAMAEEEKIKYASRGKFQKHMIDFFDGIKNAKDIFIRDGK
eukprot:g2957.t1